MYLLAQVCPLCNQITFPSLYGLAFTGKDLHQSAKLEIISLSGFFFCFYFYKKMCILHSSLFFPEKKFLDCEPLLILHSHAGCRKQPSPVLWGSALKVWVVGCTLHSSPSLLGEKVRIVCFLPISHSHATHNKPPVH